MAFAGTDAVVPTSLNLADLVDHRQAVDASLTVETVDRMFQSAPHHDFAAVVSDRRAIGICSHSQVRGLLGGRYGFALHSRAPIGQHLLPRCSFVQMGTPLREVLELALARTGDEFYEDVVLIDVDGALLGLISTQRLVTAQSTLIQEQFQLVASQRRQLERANADLADSLAQQRDLERHVIQKEKAALMQTLAGGIAHEINNKLMPMIGYAELLIEEVSGIGDGRLATYCETMRDSGFEAARIIRQLLQLSKPSPPELSLCDLRTLVEQGLTLVALRLKETGTTVDLQLPSTPVPVRADAGLIKQVLLNLVLNAIDAMEATSNRRLTITMDNQGPQVCLVVSDCGSGIDADSLSHIFDPFFTTKEPNRGSGLGLSVCLSIIRQHGGEIAVDSTAGTGTTFRITLRREPDAPDPPPADRPAAHPVVASRPALPVLVVDDEDLVAGFLGDALAWRYGCEVRRAVDGQDAIEKLSATDFALVVSDVRMPRLNGAELLDWIRLNRPEVLDRLIFVTGDGRGSALNARIEESGIPILRKPLTVEMLMSHTQSVFGRAQLGDGFTPDSG